MTEPLLEIRELHAAYGSVPALRGISLHADAGEVVCIVGANGAGKTTALRVIGGLLKPSRGTIRLEGVDVTGKRAAELVRHGVAHVPEGRQILAQMTVRENLELGGYQRADRRGLKAEMLGLMERFPVLGARREERAGSLSGGEQQLLAIARGLLAAPRLLLLDEPSTGLAPRLVSSIFALLRSLRDESRTILLVEQNARQALRISDRAYVMASGRIAVEGTAAQLLDDPRIAGAYLGNVAALSTPAQPAAGSRDAAARPEVEA